MACAPGKAVPHGKDDVQYMCPSLPRQGTKGKWVGVVLGRERRWTNGVGGSTDQLTAKLPLSVAK